MTPSISMSTASGLLPLWQGALLPLVALAWPLFIGASTALPTIRPHAIRLLPLAPLPALALALFPPAEAATSVPALLLGVQLELDGTARALLGMTAALWLAAGVYTSAYMKAPSKPAVFGGLWCLTLTGNLGVFLAADAVTFYVAFAAVSLAAYFLVVHDGTREALRAARVYIVLAIVGEAMLLIGFILLMAGAESTLITDLRESLAGDGMNPILRGSAIGLLVAGFGIKAGMMPLHVWLPLAHSAAPTPASAVLSGAIVKAGLIGLMRFLPGDEALIGALMIALGLTGTYLAVVLGLGQSRIKVVLAYSTISQMGLLIATVGTGVMANRSEAVQAATYYALHHGFAKGALFLSVGLLPLTRGRARGLLLALLALICASIAGLPGTAGALAKAVIKPEFAGPLKTAITVSSVSTVLILARFMFLAVRLRGGAASLPISPALWIPVLLTGLAALILPWLIWPAFDPRPVADTLDPASVVSGLWPILLGIALAGVLGRRILRRDSRYPRVAEGDLVGPFERRTERLVEAARQRPDREPTAPARGAARAERMAEWLERRVQRWPVASLIMLGLLLAIALGIAS
jgi:formate hydrogenlyase subunit 3/multisubunit Na+/H+ antiporter MnhD subunit